jgi:hypothetical protein
MTDTPRDGKNRAIDELRTLQCPFCGHISTSRGIGAVYCGPHKVSDTYFPATQMKELYFRMDKSHLERKE